MAVYPFILLKNKHLQKNKILMNHEKIHLRQQLELCIVPFYILYLLHYCVNLVVYQNHDKAYRTIIFEREAYDNEHNMEYLTTRKFANFIYGSAINVMFLLSL